MHNKIHSFSSLLYVVRVCSFFHCAFIKRLMSDVCGRPALTHTHTHILNRTEFMVVVAAVAVAVVVCIIEPFSFPFSSYSAAADGVRKK